MRSLATVIALIGIGLPATLSEPAAAQDFGRAPPNADAAPLPFYAGFAWHGNALDQEILDAQAEMRPMYGHRWHHRRHHH